MAINKIERRQRIRYRIRKVVNGTAQRPRMSVFRSNKQIYVQLIDDLKGVTLVAASSLEKAVAEQVYLDSGLFFGGCRAYQNYPVAIHIVSAVSLEICLRAVGL